MPEESLWDYAWFSFAIGDSPNVDEPTRVVFVPVNPELAPLRAFQAVFGHWAVPLNFRQSPPESMVDLAGNAGYGFFRGHPTGVRIDDQTVFLGGFAEQIEATMLPDERLGSSGPAGWEHEVATQVLQAAIHLAEGGLGVIVGAGAKEAWSRYRNARRRPISATDAENAARSLIGLEFGLDQESLVDASVRRAESDDAWVVRLQAPTQGRCYVLKLSDSNGTGSIEYEPIGK